MAPEEKRSYKPAGRQSIQKSFPKITSQATPAISSDTSSEDTPSGDGSQSKFGGLFDGAGEFPPGKPMGSPFGGDATWDHSGEWNNGERTSRVRRGNSQASAGAQSSPAANAFPAPDNEWELAPDNAHSPRWDTRASSTSKHFNEEWDQPSQSAQQAVEQVPSPHSNQRSGRHGRSSSSHHSSQGLNTNEWGAGQHTQPSPAIVINVNHGPTPSRFGPPSVASSWAEKPLPASMYPSISFTQPPQGHVGSPNSSTNSGSTRSASNKSGSNHGGFNKSNASPNGNNGGKDWQATAGQTKNWGVDTSRIPGAWGHSDNQPQDAWKDENGDRGGGPNWSGVNEQSNNGQNKDVEHSWNNTGANGSQHGIARNGSKEQAWGDQWTNEQVLNAYPEWASPQAQSQQGTGPDSNHIQQQKDWTNSNGGGNGNEFGSGSGNDSGHNDKPGGVENRVNSIKDEPIGLFGSRPVPASESAKREESIKTKHAKGDAKSGWGLSEPLSLPSQPKPYWSTWNHFPSSEESEIEDEPMHDLEPDEGPLYSIPAEVAQRNNMSHQVQVGKPAVYVHKTSRPKYMDTHDNPYAVFTFQYRSRAVIEKMFEVSLAETEEEEKERLSALSKEELIEHYLRVKASASSQKSASGSNGSDKPDNVATAGLGFGGELANKLAQQLSASKAPSEKASTDPELHWGRPGSHEQGRNNAATASNANVAGWLSNGGGGGIGSPPHNSGGSNRGHGNGIPSGDAWDGGSNGWKSNNGENQAGNFSAKGSTGNHHGKPGASGGGNGTSWTNGNSGRTGSGSQNGKKAAWKMDGRANATGSNENKNQSSWDGGASGNQNGNSWETTGAVEPSWNGGGGDNSGGDTTAPIIEW